MTTMHIPVSEAVLRRLGERAAEQGVPLEEFAGKVLEREAGTATSEQSSEQWIAELRAWAASHPHRPLTLDDSRESIYEGRGE